MPGAPRRTWSWVWFGVAPMARAQGSALGKCFCFVACRITSPGKLRGLAPRCAVPTVAPVLWTVSGILFGLWVLGLLSGGTEGAWVHLLLAFAVVSLALASLRSVPRQAIREPARKSR